MSNLGEFLLDSWAGKISGKEVMTKGKIWEGNKVVL